MIIIFMVVSIITKIRARLKNKLISKTLVVGKLAHEILGPYLIIEKCFKDPEAGCLVKHFKCGYIKAEIIRNFNEPI